MSRKKTIGPSAQVLEFCETIPGYREKYEQACQDADSIPGKMDLYAQWPVEYDAFKNQKSPQKGRKRYRLAPELKDFRAWLKHVGPRPDDSLSVDRPDTTVRYRLNNMQWATKYEQTENRPVTRWHQMPGDDKRKLRTKQLAYELDMKEDTVSKALRRGKTVEQLIQAHGLRTSPKVLWTFDQLSDIHRGLIATLEPAFEKTRLPKETRLDWLIRTLGHQLRASRRTFHELQGVRALLHEAESIRDQFAAQEDRDKAVQDTGLLEDLLGSLSAVSSPGFPSSQAPKEEPATLEEVEEIMKNLGLSSSASPKSQKEPPATLERSLEIGKKFGLSPPSPHQPASLEETLEIFGSDMNEEEWNVMCAQAGLSLPYPAPSSSDAGDEPAPLAAAQVPTMTVDLSILDNWDGPLPLPLRILKGEHATQDDQTL